MFKLVNASLEGQKIQAAEANGVVYAYFRPRFERKKIWNALVKCEKYPIASHWAAMDGRKVPLEIRKATDRVTGSISAP